MLKIITNKVKSSLAFQTSENHSLKHKLIKGAAGSFGIQVSSSVLAFVMSILFARCLGTVGLGTYSYATTWANLLSIPATLGIHQLIVREIAVYRVQSRWRLMRGILSWANILEKIIRKSVAAVLMGEIEINNSFANI